MTNELAVNELIELLYRDYLGEFSFFKNPSFYDGLCPHWLVPAANLNTHVSSSIPASSRFNFQIRRPKPLLPPSSVSFSQLRERGDPLEVVAQTKQKWTSELNTLIALAQKSKKWAEPSRALFHVLNQCVKNLSFNFEVCLPCSPLDQQEYGLHTSKVKKKSNLNHIYSVTGYLDVAKHFERDPYPNFSGDYNWMYTGGCITSCNVNEEKYLLFPHKETMDTLWAADFTHQNALLATEDKVPSISLPLTQGQRIYQIVAKEMDSKGLVGIRQEHVCSVVRLKQGSKKPLSARVLLEIQEEDASFVSIDMNSAEAQICTTDSNKLLKLWDLNSSSCTASVEVPPPEHQSNSSPWSCVKFGNTSHELLVANRSTIFAKDCRMPLESGMELAIRSLVDDCEDITLLLTSPSSSLIYVCTSHHLLSLDLRFGWNQRWTHLMEGAPMYGSIYSDLRNGEEVVLLSSCIPDDCVAVANKCDHEKTVSETIPRSLPSLKDCLVLARSRGECLGPNFKKRLDMATSGLTVLPSRDNEGFTSLKITSIGDVFSQEFLHELTCNQTGVPNFEEEIDSDIEVWKNWEEAHDQIGVKSSHDLHCATVSQEHIVKAITAPMGKDSTKVMRIDIAKWQETFPVKKRLIFNRHNFPFEHDSTPYSHFLQELNSHTDLMAGVLLQAWDTDGLFSVPDPSKYVDTWLDTISPGQRDPDASSVSGFSDVPSQSLMSSYRVNLGPGRSADNADESVFKVPQTPQTRPAKKVKRESLGF